jgi:hypothetical protein
MLLGTPLTELVLDRLGAPRWLWIGLWAALPVAAPVLLLGALALSGDSDRVPSAIDVFIPQAVLSYVVLLLLWGNGRLGRQADALVPHLSRLTGAPVRLGLPAWSDIAGPAALAIALTAVALASWIPRVGLVVAIVIVPPFLATFLAIMTFVWTYLALLLGLDRLGRERLLLEGFPQDTSLGLAPVGALAFTGFGLLLAGALPVPVSNADDLVSVVVSLAVLALSVVLLLLSMWRLHRQMVDAKARHVAATQAAYAAAYEPYRVDGSLSTLEAQSSVLGAAEALTERANQIREWPIDQRVGRIMSFAVAAVASTIIGRFVLLALAG